MLANSRRDIFIRLSVAAMPHLFDLIDPDLISVVEHRLLAVANNNSARDYAHTHTWSIIHIHGL